jgi:hypothetical protein
MFSIIFISRFWRAFVNTMTKVNYTWTAAILLKMILFQGAFLFKQKNKLEIKINENVVPYIYSPIWLYGVVLN